MMKKHTWKRALVLGGIFGTCTILLSGCGSGKAVKRISKAGVLNVVLYQQTDESTELGALEKNLIDTIASGLGVDVEYADADSMEDAQSKLLDGSADLAIGGITAETEISKKLEMSDVYETTSLYVVTRRGDYSNSPAAFSGRTLAFTESLPESAVTWTDEVEDLKPVYIDGDSVAAGLSQEKIDGYVCTHQEAETLADTYSSLQYQNLLGVDQTGYVILMKSGEDKLLSGVNTIIEMTASSENPSETSASEETESSKGEK